MFEHAHTNLHVFNLQKSAFLKGPLSTIGTTLLSGRAMKRSTFRQIANTRVEGLFGPIPRALSRRGHCLSQFRSNCGGKGFKMARFAMQIESPLRLLEQVADSG
jgi:hypothetical protein